MYICIYNCHNNAKDKEVFLKSPSRLLNLPIKTGDFSVYINYANKEFSNYFV